MHGLRHDRDECHERQGACCAGHSRLWPLLAFSECSSSRAEPAAPHPPTSPAMHAPTYPCFGSAGSQLFVHHTPRLPHAGYARHPFPVLDAASRSCAALHRISTAPVALGFCPVCAPDACACTAFCSAQAEVTDWVLLHAGSSMCLSCLVMSSSCMPLQPCPAHAVARSPLSQVLQGAPLSKAPVFPCTRASLLTPLHSCCESIVRVVCGDGVCARPAWFAPPSFGSTALALCTHGKCKRSQALPCTP